MAPRLLAEINLVPAGTKTNPFTYILWQMKNAVSGENG